MEPIKNPIELPSQNPELTSPGAEIPKSPEKEILTPESRVRAEIAANDDPLQAEQTALEKHDISEAISIPETQDKLTNKLTESEDDLLRQLSKAN